MDRDAKAFGRRLTAILLILGILTAGAVFLFGHLLFRALSKDVVADALLRSKLDAERIARDLKGPSAAEPYVLRLKQTEIDGLVRSGLTEREIFTELEILDVKTGRILYAFRGTSNLPEDEPAGAEGLGVQSVEPPGLPRTYSVTRTLASPYDIEVPIGDQFVLRYGVNRRELEQRVETLRRRLYSRTAAAASVSLLGIAAASAAVILLYRRTQRIEEARVEAERRAELGEVAAGLAHEIRNPLNAMGLNLELLEEQLQRGAAAGTAPVSAAELAQAARQETGRLSRMLADFLSYARPSPIEPAGADLNEPAAEAVGFLKPEAERRRIRLTFTPHAGGAPARLDTARVKQVVLNLVANALDAVEGEGAIAREVHVRVDEDGDFWRLTVADRGAGVPAEAGRDVFKAFFSTKPAGTGLGLPIAERIVKAHGGELTLSSEEGQPTRAVATFPKTARGS